MEEGVFNLTLGVQAGSLTFQQTAKRDEESKQMAISIKTDFQERISYKSQALSFGTKTYFVSRNGKVISVTGGE